MSITHSYKMSYPLLVSYIHDPCEGQGSPSPNFGSNISDHPEGCSAHRPYPISRHVPMLHPALSGPHHHNRDGSCQTLAILGFRRRNRMRRTALHDVDPMNRSNRDSMASTSAPTGRQMNRTFTAMRRKPRLYEVRDFEDGPIYDNLKKGTLSHLQIVYFPAAPRPFKPSFHDETSLLPGTLLGSLRHRYQGAEARR